MDSILAMWGAVQHNAPLTGPPLRLYVRVHRHLFAGLAMTNTAVPHPGGSLAEALEQRHRAGRPVRIGLIGAGQMGTDILVQVAQMRGIEVVAAADTVPDIVLTACAVAGDATRKPVIVEGPGTVAAVA